MAITSQREDELIELLWNAIGKHCEKGLIQQHPPCPVCRNRSFDEHEYDFHPSKRGILVKVAICACGQKIFPGTERVH